MVILSVFRVRFPPVLGSETFFWICDKASVANSLLLNYQAASQFNMMNNIVRPTLYSRIVTTMFKQQPCKYLCVLAAIIWVTERYLCARINPTSNIPPPNITSWPLFIKMKAVVIFFSLRLRLTSGEIRSLRCKRWHEGRIWNVVKNVARARFFPFMWNEVENYSSVRLPLKV